MSDVEHTKKQTQTEISTLCSNINVSPVTQAALHPSFQRCNTAQCP